MNAEDLLQLLERCKAGLKEDGLVIIKENVCERGFVVDLVSACALAEIVSPSQSYAKHSTSLLYQTPMKVLPIELSDYHLSMRRSHVRRP